MEQQQQIIREQDEQLNLVGQSIGRLKEMGTMIGMLAVLYMLARYDIKRESSRNIFEGDAAENCSKLNPRSQTYYLHGTHLSSRIKARQVRSIPPGFYSDTFLISPNPHPDPYPNPYLNYTPMCRVTIRLPFHFWGVCTTSSLVDGL